MSLQKINILTPTSPNRSTGIINGKASGILNWNDIAYPSFYRIYRELLGNFWIPQEINMSHDIKQYSSLSQEEKYAFEMIIGLLATLDSPQTRYIYNVAEYVTDASVHGITAIIAQQEVIHNESYSYILSSLLPFDEQQRIFEAARTNPIIIKRNDAIMDSYNVFLENKSAKTLIYSMIQSLILEGVNFYSGFAYFYNLARQQKMVGTSTMIGYINRDELVHGKFMSELLRAILNENPELNNDEFVSYTYDSFKTAVEREIEWGQHVLNGIIGIDQDEMAGYVKYRANKMLNMLGLEAAYPGFEENPMRWITAYTDNFNNTKTDFFEQKSRNYAKTNDLNGFDDL